jgi:hypothetical protein
MKSIIMMPIVWLTFMSHVIHREKQAVAKALKCLISFLILFCAVRQNAPRLYCVPNLGVFLLSVSPPVCQLKWDLL